MLDLESTFVELTAGAALGIDDNFPPGELVVEEEAIMVTNSF